MIDSFIVVYYSFVFLVSGYIIDSIICTIMPVDRTSEKILLIRYIAYGVVDFVALFLVPWEKLHIRIEPNEIKQMEINDLFILTGGVVISSAILGVLIGQIRKCDCIRRLLKVFGSKTKHPIPTSWEYFFENCENGARIEVHLKNGEVILGEYGDQSFSSSDLKNLDLYFENVQRLEKHRKKKGNSGKQVGAMWIGKESIDYLIILNEQ